MLRITDIKARVEDDAPDLRPLVAGRLRIRPEDVASVHVRRRSLDARKKSQFYFVYTVDAELKDKAPLKGGVLARPGVRLVEAAQPAPTPVLKQPPSPRPVVVGMGPAGLFAALTLAEAGAAPVVLERGRELEARAADTARFWREGVLDTESNVQFGEGGAGAFSDGKLTTRIDDPRVSGVLGALVGLGAPPEIAFEARPHVGTDRLKGVLKRMRAALAELGCELVFGARVEGLAVDGGRVRGLEVRRGSAVERLDARHVLFAPGNAARDSFEMLVKCGARIEPKPFAVGLRVEHPRGLIDRIQHGRYAGHPKLGAADYMLTWQDASTGRAAYSFCMCPGGRVIASSTEEHGVVVNGMSHHARDAVCSNSALVVTVKPSDFQSSGPLAGVEFQRRWERAAYEEGGGGYAAPAQDMESFMRGAPGGDLGLASYLPGVRPADLARCLPDYVVAALRGALSGFDRKMKGFLHPKAVLTGVETRTSSPVRILRGDDLQAVGVAGLYPCGEGSGYAGGIVSSAVDGVKAAEALLSELVR